MIEIEIGIDIIHELLISLEDGIINPSDSYIINVFDINDFNEMINKISEHFNGKIEEMEIEYGEGYSILWINDIYILIYYSRRFNNSYSIDINMYKFKYEIEKYLDIDYEKLEQEPIGIEEDN